ncbi:MAG: hypothetical protein ACRBDL_01540 [Alphaproteobacteria bacterium]
MTKQTQNETKTDYFIALITGITPEDKNFWAYLAIPFEMYDLYRIAEAEGDFDMEDYGKVLAFGLGNTPPKKTRQDMVEKYNLDEDFENKLATISEFLGEDIL